MPGDFSDTFDIFGTAPPGTSLGHEWPEPGRFPLNRDSAKVEHVVLGDLRKSDNPLIVTGFATLDRLIDFVATANACKQIRVVFGSEPFDSRRDTFSIDHYDLPREMKEYWIEQGISIRLSGKLIHCIDRLKARTLLTRYIPQGTRLHAKIYVGCDAATLGSSNFTDPGLRNQLETNARFVRAAEDAKGARAEEGRRYREAAAIAERFWDMGRDYNDHLIDLLNKLLKLVAWQEAIARAATELLDGEWAQRFLHGEYLPGDKALWPSQRLGIAQALYILKERGSVLFADATGSGKTLAGIHLIGAKMHEIVASNRLRQGKALMICPPAVVGNWANEGAKAGVPLDVYSHGGLSRSGRSSRESSLLSNLRRAQLLCVDEGHNFLNVKSNRTQQLLRNMADHVALFTATPINRSAADLLRIADMLGADNLDISTIKAFEKMLGVRSISRGLSGDEISELRGEIAKFTVRRTKRMLNDLIRKDPDAYRDANGRRCRFPKHDPHTYSLSETAHDIKTAARIRELASELKGVLHFRKEILLPKALKRRGITEEQYLQGRLSAASRLSQYMVMRSLRSSRAALLEHLLGTSAAAAVYDLDGFTRRTRSGNVIASIEDAAGKLPKNRLNVELPDWLCEVSAHQQACEQEAAVYSEIAKLTKQISGVREEKKASHLARLSQRFDHILAFDSRPITLAVIRKLLKVEAPTLDVLIATGDTGSDRGDLLDRFAPSSDEPGKVAGLCSDSVSEGVNLQRAQVVVHLDMPSVVRIAEQRVGRVDRLDSPYRKIYAWWPNDADEFALRTDERFIERYETVDNLLGSNMPLPDEIRDKSAVPFTAHDAIKDFETNAESWDGIEDAFSPVRALVEGNAALIPNETYADYERIKARVIARVSLVSAKRPWAFFCTRDSSNVPKWILLEHRDAAPETDLKTICVALRGRLGPDVEDVTTFTATTERIIDQFLNRLMSAERELLSRRKQRALQEMEAVLTKYVDSAAKRRDQDTLEFLLTLLNLLRRPALDNQPDWEEVAARWLDLIRPVWYEKLQDRHHRPLLLKDIRKDVISAEEQLLPTLLREFRKDFPKQREPDKRIVACIVGIG